MVQNPPSIAPFWTPRCDFQRQSVSYLQTWPHFCSSDSLWKPARDNHRDQISEVCLCTDNLYPVAVLLFSPHLGGMGGKFPPIFWGPKVQWGENFPPIFEIRNWIFVELRGFSFRTGLETFKNVIFRAAPAAGCQKEGNKGLFNEFLKMIPPFLRKFPPIFWASELNGGKFSPHSERKMQTLGTIPSAISRCWNANFALSCSGAVVYLPIVPYAMLDHYKSFSWNFAHLNGG